MQSTIPGPLETIVSSSHGNAGFADAVNPVTITHYSQGAVIDPPLPGAAPADHSRIPESKQKKSVPIIIGKVHYALPALRAPDEENSLGRLVDGIVSTALDISVAPCSSNWKADDTPQGTALSPTEQSTSKITAVDIYAGRELLWSSDKVPEGQHIDLPTDQDVRLHVVSVVWPEDARRFNENVRGLGVTLTIEFGDDSSGLMVSSIALVQDLQRLRRE